ncbi:MAG: hypothetical protein IBX52_12115 [Bacterioplanes sp.]|nr:hypothetical protein [Bacterioplanes sp.]
MEMVKVEWHAATGEWQAIPCILGVYQPSQPLSEWASTVPDLSDATLILSARHYSTHWLSLPGVSARHLNKALPFALEEYLVDDLSKYVICAAGQVQKRVRAYVVASDLIEQLLEQCELHHVRVKALFAETQLLPNQPLLLRQDDGWLIRMDGCFEGWVPDNALTPVCESLFAEQEQGQLTVAAPTVDQANLVKTTLLSSYPNAFTDIAIDVTQGNEWRQQTELKTLTTLLQGPFHVVAPQTSSRLSVFKSVMALAASVVVVMTTQLWIAQQQIKQQEIQVRAQSAALYQQLFPGERIRFLERQFRDKLRDGGDTPQVGFVPLVHQTAKTLADNDLQKNITLDSLRFNDRQQEIILEVRASNLQALQAFRQALEQVGLVAEISSASNDDKGVKGRMRVGGAA